MPAIHAALPSATAASQPNVARQPSACAIHADNGALTTLDNVTPANTIASALPCRSAGASPAPTAVATGLTAPAPMPATIRVASSQPKLGASAPASVASDVVSRPAISTPRRRRMPDQHLQHRRAKRERDRERRHQERRAPRRDPPVGGERRQYAHDAVRHAARREIGARERTQRVTLGFVRLHRMPLESPVAATETASRDSLRIPLIYLKSILRIGAIYMGNMSAEWRGADLALLAALDVLLEEANVTRATARLHLSQPALSAQLARLRELIGDPLLLPAKNGRGMVPTARALALQGPLRGALRELQAARCVTAPRSIPRPTNARSRSSRATTAS
ncbi:bacterial regulatory helix-turn-helix, lysR family protein [Burkholderia thailandensis E254]|nr:bacterial regulatory helix-turn-helix, lysR family protein [Burkholderia thailandensis MSMB59]AIT20815.1 bacterial regulatory helix-turn-helix, lysR family protein [Burkholderia thailandensis E254]